MTTIIIWIFVSIFDSLSVSNRRKSINESNLSRTLFKWISYPFSFVFMLWLVYFIWIEKIIFKDYIYLLLLFWIILIWIWGTYLNLHIAKRIKLSELMPYGNLDKIFIIIFWYFFYYWSEKWVSLTTLLICLFTIVVIFMLSVDIKKLKIPKLIKLYTFWKLISSFNKLSLSYILIKYSSLTVLSVNWLFNFMMFSIIALSLKDPLIDLIKQSKIFYVNRMFSTVFWQAWLVLSFFIIQTSWIVIATLIWFLWIVFNIVSMKIILKDNPTKKQIILAFIVISLIWLGYYFK